MTWGFPSRLDGAVLFPEEPLPQNTTPCRRCHRVYPFVGTPKQLAELLEHLGQLCPGCYLGPSHTPRLSVGEVRLGAFLQAEHRGRGRGGRRVTRGAIL